MTWFGGSRVPMAPKNLERQIVSRGVALLDKKRPGWKDEIDTEALNIGSTLDCVLGQLYGEYTIGLQQLQIASPKTYGFSCDALCQLTKLNNEWKLAISA